MKINPCEYLNGFLIFFLNYLLTKIKLLLKFEFLLKYKQSIFSVFSDIDTTRLHPKPWIHLVLLLKNKN